MYSEVSIFGNCRLSDLHATAKDTSLANCSYDNSLIKF